MRPRPKQPATGSAGGEQRSSSRLRLPSGGRTARTTDVGMCATGRVHAGNALIMRAGAGNAPRLRQAAHPSSPISLASSGARVWWPTEMTCEAARPQDAKVGLPKACTCLQHSVHNVQWQSLPLANGDASRPVFCLASASSAEITSSRKNLRLGKGPGSRIQGAATNEHWSQDWRSAQWLAAVGLGGSHTCAAHRAGGTHGSSRRRLFFVLLVLLVGSRLGCQAPDGKGVCALWRILANSGGACEPEGAQGVAGRTSFHGNRRGAAHQVPPGRRCAVARAANPERMCSKFSPSTRRSNASLLWIPTRSLQAVTTVS